MPPRASLAGRPPGGGGGRGGLGPEPARRSAWATVRLVFAIVAIVALSGTAAAALAFNEVSKITKALDEKPVVKVAPKVLAPTYGGAPQTLLLVGNDERPPPKGESAEHRVVPHSNEMLLVRINPNKPTISMLSIPRELQVTFTTPNGEVITNRFNSAYTYGVEEGGGVKGGIKLMVETIKKVLGLGVNHVFIVDFKKFERAVREMGCVYFPVDKRYWHTNLPEGQGEQYMEIHIKPGYQRLCGKEALEFVANRHESTSLVRDARDQRFVLETKREYGGNLFEEREKFEKIFGRNIETDLRGEKQVLNLLELLVQSQGKPVRQIHFNVEIVPINATNCGCVLASQEQIHEAVTKFLGGTSKITKRRVDKALSVVKRRKPHAKNHEPSMTPTSAEAIDNARKLAPYLPFALEYPRIRNTIEGAEPDKVRLYKLHGPHGHPYPSYVIVIDRGLLGQYYDVEGTTWLHPPILNNPSQNVKVGSRYYSLYYSGEHITTIAWREGKAVYWVENTLSNDVSPRQMIEIAEETQPVDRSVTRSPLKRAKKAEVALKVTAASNSSSGGLLSSKKLAILVAALAILGILVLLVLILRQRRHLRYLREDLTDIAAAGLRRR